MISHDYYHIYRYLSLTPTSIPKPFSDGNSQLPILWRGKHFSHKATSASQQACRKKRMKSCPQLMTLNIQEKDYSE